MKSLTKKEIQELKNYSDYWTKNIYVWEKCDYDDLKVARILKKILKKIKK